MYNRTWEPMTVEDANGNITVYKGFCIQATCYTSVEQVKELLGEIPKRKPIRTSNATSMSPIPTKSSTRINTPSPCSLASSGSQKRQFQMDGVFVPPIVPKLESEGSKHFNHDFPVYPEGEPNHNSSGYLDLKTTMEGLPEEKEIKSLSKKSALFQSSRRLRRSRKSDGSESDFSGSLYDADNSASRVYGSFRSSFHASDIGGREHSNLLLDSFSARDLGDAALVTSGEAASNIAIEELKAQIAAGDYVKFIAELDRRCAGGLDDEEKIIVLEGLRLFRYHVVKDQLSRPNGVVLPGENWVKTINYKLGDCNSDKDIVLSCLLTFLTLSTLPGSTYKKSMVKKRGVDAVMKILDDYKGDKQIPALASSLFLSLGLSEKDGLNAKFDKIVPLVTRLVSMVANDEWGRDFALRALFHFAFQRRRAADTNKSLSHDVKFFLSKQENLKRLCEVIQEDQVRETAVESSLSLLWRLSGPKDNSEDVDLLPVSPDVVDAIIMAMDTFDSTAIREAGCGILANMAMREIFPSDRFEAALVSINAFLQHPEREGMVDEGLATCAMHAICNFLEDRSSAKVAMPVRTNLIKATLEVMKQFADLEELIEFACLVIAHATRANHSMKEAVMTLGGFSQIRDAFEEFVTSRAEKPSLEVKDAALCALASLTGCRAGAEAVLQSGLLEILQTLLAVETDKDFADILGIVVKNTENGLAGDFDESTLDVVRDQPHIFGEYLKNASSSGEVAGIFQSLVGVGQNGLEVSVAGDKEFSAIVAALSEYRNSEEVQEAGCALLSEVYYYIPYPPKSVQGPWDPRHQRESLLSVERAMETHRENVDVQINGYLVILNLMSGLSDVNRDRTAASSLMERCLNRILETLLRHHLNRTVQKRGIAALGACICISEEMFMNEWTARIVTQLFQTSSQFIGDSEIQVLVLDDLIMMLGMRQGIDSVGTSAGISILLDLLASSTVDISVRAAAILASLVEYDFMVSGRIIEVSDSIARLLLCMSANQDDQGLQVCIASILESLVNYADSDAVEKILQSNGVATLCNLMSIHRKSGDFVIHTCNILATIFPCLDAQTISSMSDLIKQSLIVVLERYVENPDVETAVFDALWACCQQEDTFKRLLLEESRIRMILSAMQLNLGSHELQRSGCSLLWMLSSFSSGKEKIGSCGGIPTIVNALLAHNESTAVQKEGLIALKNLAISSSNKRMLADAGGDNAVMCSLWIHYRDPQVISIGLSAMNNIAVDSQTRSVAEMNDQVLSIVIAAMSQYPENGEVQKNACFYLKSCSYLPANLELMKSRSRQLVPLLVKAADDFPDHCRDRGSSVIRKMQ
jgi:hypothetical protein